MIFNIKNAGYLCDSWCSRLIILMGSLTVKKKLTIFFAMIFIFFQRIPPIKSAFFFNFVHKNVQNFRRITEYVC